MELLLSKGIATPLLYARRLLFMAGIELVGANDDCDDDDRGIRNHN